MRKHDPDREALAAEEFELDGWVIERTCPHRQADLKVFGEIDGDEFVCTLHGWRFDLATGTCRTWPTTTCGYAADSEPCGASRGEVSRPLVGDRVVLPAFTSSKRVS